MNIANSRFTISTIAVAACAMVALVAVESAQAQTAEPSVQRIEIVGPRLVPLQQIVIVGKRQAEPEVQQIAIVGKRQTEPEVQRIVITGQRLHAEHVAAAAGKATPL